jgi:hypothetical protein
MDLLASGERIGYLLKSRVIDVDEFRETLERILRGGSVVDPALVQELVAARRTRDPLYALSQRERDGLSLMAEGSIQRRYRASALGDRRNGREARAQHPLQAPIAGRRGRSQARAGRT